MATSSIVIGHNLSREIRAGIIDALGPQRSLQLLKLFNLEIKAKKFDSRAIVLTEYSIHVLTAKFPIRLEFSVNFIDIKTIESPEPSKVKFVCESRKFLLASQDGQGQDIDDLVNCILETLITVFPAISSMWMGRISLTPPSRMKELSDRLEEVRSRDATRPCGSFTFAYHYMCDYVGVPFSEEVAWDIDTIYLYQASREMLMTDFDHLETKAVVPLVSALEHNAWFTKLNFSNFRMTPEVATELCKVMKTNSCIRELILSNTGIKSDFLQRLTTAMAANTKLALTSLNVSGNVIEEKGLQCILPVIAKMSTTMTSLNVSRCAVAGKALRKLGETLSHNVGFLKSLQCLDLSENSLKGEDLSHFYKYLSQPNAITTLSLAGTECALETLFAALSTGCVNHLVHLDVSRCVYSNKKLTRDVSVPMYWKDFFSRATALQSVSFAGCRLPSEAVNFVLVGLSLNNTIKNLDLNLSMSALGAGGSQVLEVLIANIRCIGSLDISDNGLDQNLTGVLAQLSKNKCIKRLAIGKNMNSIRPKAVPQVMEAIVQFIQNERSSVQSLMLDDLKLKTDLNVLLSALGSNTTLTELDISGNAVGDTGARMLSKALLMNKKLATIHWDRNNTSPQGFSDIAAALERNFTLKRMPVPFSDVTAAMKVNVERTETALQKIETLLQRNHLPHRIAVEQIYRLQHGLMTSSSQQLIDSTIVQLQNLIGGLQSAGTPLPDGIHETISHAQNLIRDVTAARQLMLEFQGLAQECEGDSAVVSQRLKSLATELQSVVEKQLQSTTGSMLQRAKKQCGAVFTDKLTDELRAGVSSLNNPHEQVRDVILQQLGCNLLNCVSDVNFSVASFIYSHLVEEFMLALDADLTFLKQSSAGVRQCKRQNSVSPTMDGGKLHGGGPRPGIVSNSPSGNDENQDMHCMEMRRTLQSRKLRPQFSAPEEPHPSIAHMTGTTRSIYAPTIDYNDIVPDADAPRLVHLGKERPRLRKAPPAKRPVIACESLLADDGADDVGVNLNQLSLSAPPAVHSPMQENSSPLHPAAAAAGKPTDDELLKASVPSPEEAPAQQLEHSVPSDPIQPAIPQRLSSQSDSVPSTNLPRARSAEETASETRQGTLPPTAPRTKPAEDSLESKRAPAAVSESELIQPVRKPYINRSQPLANIMKGSMETNDGRDVDSKFAKRPAESDAKDSSETSKSPPFVTKGDRPAVLPIRQPAPAPAVRPRKPAVKPDIGSSPTTPTDIPVYPDVSGSTTAVTPQNDKTQQSKPESKDATKSDGVVRPAQAGDAPVKTEAGVGKRSSVRDMAALFKK